MFVRALANVKIVTPKVSNSRTMFTVVSPRTMVWSITNPMVNAAGTVRLMLASTDPKSKFTERWS
jgi:hypothetical protein